MQCPYCHSEVPDGTKICPVCHGDIEAELVRLRGADAYSRPAPLADEPAPQRSVQSPQTAFATPTQPTAPQGFVPAYGNQSAGATGTNQGGPVDPNQPMRSFDSSQMKQSPKWPIVLIALLVVAIIIIAALLVFNFFFKDKSVSTLHSAQINATSVQSDTANPESTSAGQPAADAQNTQEATTEQQTSQQPAAADDQQVYSTLTTAYESALGFNDQISALAGRFNAEDLLHADVATRTSARDEAAATQQQIDATSTSIAGLVLAQDSAYAGVKDTLATVYNDLSHRMDVLVRSLNESLNAGEDPAAADGVVAEILSADNGADGVNIYKAEYDSIIDSAKPAAPAAPAA